MSRRQSKQSRRFSNDVQTVVMGEELATPLYPAEFLKHLLREKDIAEADFCRALGYGDRYIDELFNSGVNRGTHALPRPLAHKLETLTGINVNFWRADTFKFDQIAKINIDLDAASPRWQEKENAKPATRNEGRG